MAHWAAAAIGLLNRHRCLSSRTVYAESAGLADIPTGSGPTLQGSSPFRRTANGSGGMPGELWSACREWAEDHDMVGDDDALAGLGS